MTADRLNEIREGAKTRGVFTAGDGERAVWVVGWDDVIDLLATLDTAEQREKDALIEAGNESRRAQRAEVNLREAEQRAEHPVFREQDDYLKLEVERDLAEQRAVQAEQERDEWRLSASDKGLPLPSETIQRRLAEAEARLAETQAWGRQVHDALDGRPLPEHPDEAPARIAVLMARLAETQKALEAMTDDALQLLDQHISSEVRMETQRRIIERAAALTTHHTADE